MMYLDASSGSCPNVDLWLNGVNIADTTVEAFVYPFPGVPAYGWVKRVVLDEHGLLVLAPNGAPDTVSEVGVVWWDYAGKPAAAVH